MFPTSTTTIHWEAIKAANTGRGFQCVEPACCRVRDFEVVDAHPFGVLLKWEKDGAATSQVLFKRMGPTPSLKALTLLRYTICT